MRRLIKFLFILSVLVFLVMTMYVYAFLPDTLYIKTSYGNLSMSNDTFFYWSNGLFVLLISLAFMFTYVLSGVRSNEQTFFNAAFKEQIIIWSTGLRLVISIFFTLSISFLGMSQNDDNFEITNFAFLVYIGPILFFIWIFSIFFTLPKNT